MYTARLALATALGALAATSCGSDGGTSAGTTSGTSASTGANSSSTSDAPPTTDTPTTTASPTQGSTDGTSSGDSTSSTGDTSSGGSTSSASSGTSTSTSTGSESTGGGMPIAFFDCTELTVVDLQLKEKISGAFDAQGVPLDVLATMVKGGAIDFHIAVAGPVAADDPYAADVAFWEQELTTQGWDVNPPGDPSGDRRYIFIPEGAQFVAKFSLFYYRVYEGGGNGQFEFECIKQ